MSRWVVLSACLAVVLFAFNVAADVQCNRNVAVPVGVNCNCTADTLIYDYSENTCVDPTELYGTADFCGLNAELDEDGACTCLPMWDVGPSKRCDQPVGTCPTESCTGNSGCIDTPGEGLGHYCGCSGHYYRADSGGCVRINEASNVQWHNCPQYARYESNTPWVTCLCFHDTYFEDVGDDGLNCTLNDGYVDCSEENSPHIMCVEASDDTKEFFAYPGYNVADDNTAEDIDECEGTHTCWRDSHCSNFIGTGYECLCDEGYTDSLCDGTAVNECIPVPCCNHTGDGCVSDPCLGLCNEASEVCLQSSDYTAECIPRLSKSVALLDSQVSLMTGTLTVVNGPQYAGTVTSALNKVLGNDIVQATKRDGEVEIFDTMIILANRRLEGMSLNDVTTLLNEACIVATMNTSDTDCYLPEGLIVVRDSMQLSTPDVCVEVVPDCNEDTHNCSSLGNGRYTCECNAAPTGEYYAGYIGICNYADLCKETTIDSTVDSTSNYQTQTSPSTNEYNQSTSTESTTTTKQELTAETTVKSTTTEAMDCSNATGELQVQLGEAQQELNDAQQELNGAQQELHNVEQDLSATKDDLTVTAAVLGTLLGVSLLALGVMGFFFWKAK